MEEIRRLDRQIFVRELLRTTRVFFMLLAGLVLALGAANGIPVLALVALVSILMCVGSAWTDSKANRFHSKNFALRWAACEERMEMFEMVLKKLRKQQIADLREMPTTIRSVSESIYIALRKADVIAHEISQTELAGNTSAHAWTPGTSDPQSQALYRLADRNIAEYRAELAAVMSGVHRAEAQAAVFITTLDSLRVKMLGYRLVGRRPELPSQGFLEALAEARMQLQSIDTALDELDLGHYPRQISVVPPPMPPDEVRRIEQSQ